MKEKKGKQELSLTLLAPLPLGMTLGLVVASFVDHVLLGRPLGSSGFDDMRYLAAFDGLPIPYSKSDTPTAL